MPLTFDLDPETTPELLDSIRTLWADVSNAGGAVGFVPPVTTEDIRPELIKHLAAMAEGRTRLLVGRDESGAAAATAFFTFNTHRLMRHWCWLYSVMVHPSHQGKGYGRDLMAAVEDAARGMDGIQGIRLTCRGGTRGGPVLRVVRLQGGRPGTGGDQGRGRRLPRRRHHVATAELTSASNR